VPARGLEPEPGRGEPSSEGDAGAIASARATVRPTMPAHTTRRLGAPPLLCLYSPLGGLPWAPPFGPKRPISAPKHSLIRISSLSGFFPLSV